MYAEDKHASLEALGNRFHTVLKPKRGIADGETCGQFSEG
jgi:hypothetical protein